MTLIVPGEMLLAAWNFCVCGKAQTQKLTEETAKHFGEDVSCDLCPLWVLVMRSPSAFLGCFQTHLC